MTTDKPTATFIRDLDGFYGHASLYKCKGGNLPEYVAVSAIRESYAVETYIFEANSDGKVLSWEELDGSFRGDTNHDEALQGAGYTVVRP